MTGAPWLAAVLMALLVAGALLGSCGRPIQPDRGQHPLETGQTKEPRSGEKEFEYALSLNPYELSERRLRKALDLAQAAGVNSIVSGATWWYATASDPSEGPRLDKIDLLIDECQSRGMKLSLQVSGTPDWVHPGLEATIPEHSRRIWYPPRRQSEIQAYSDFVQLLVRRYGTKVERYIIWNEPNSVDFWRPAPDPGEYAALLRTVYTDVQNVDPRVTVSFGGVSMNDLGFLTSYYEAAREYEDARKYNYFFDEMNLHPYTYGQSPDWRGPGGTIDGINGPLDPSFAGIPGMKAIMERNRDSGKELFLGEFGYASPPAKNTWASVVPDYRRAFYLKRAYSIAAKLPYVVGMRWYSFLPDSTVGKGWTIMDETFEASLTYRALRQVTGSEATQVSVDLPTQKSPISAKYSVRPSLGAPEASASGWELYVDGKLAEASDQVPFEWDSRRVGDGTHSLVLAMYTKDGSVWASTPVRVDVQNNEDRTPEQEAETPVAR